jgi:cyclic pyranopterin phosphate synthase
MKAYTLRISVLENCQLRCGYCLPDARPKFLDKKHWLSLADYQKIARVLQDFSLAKIRFTGGEPLLRPDLPQIVSIFSQTLPKIPLALTTNGLRFNKNCAQNLKYAGLSTITFHLDTLVPDRYEKIMGKGQVITVLDALKRAQDLGFKTKINTVVQKDLNSSELREFLLLSKKLGVEVRFIEIMNTGSAAGFVAHNFISGSDILSLLAQDFNLRPLARIHESDPAEGFFVEELGLRFGLIASDTRPFCQNCTRLRLSADGRLHTCLYDNDAEQLNFENDEESIKASIKAKIARKTSLHPLVQLPRRIFSMSQTGG